MASAGALRGKHIALGIFLLLVGFWAGKRSASADTAAWEVQLARLREAAPQCPPCECPKQEPCSEQKQCPPPGGCDLHKKYDLSHLTQDARQDVGGPVQDDEALLLYAVVRGLRMSRVLEIGGLSGYSAKNFLQAMTPTKGVVYTVDINPVPSVDAERHTCIQKDARLLTAADVDNKPLDLIFFDAHVLEPQMDMYQGLVDAGVVTNKTILAFHDTNTHPFKTAPWSFETEQGWVHQDVERKMVNRFHDMGWDAFMLHPRKELHNPENFPYRHGLIVMQKFERLLVEPSDKSRTTKQH